MTAPRVWTVTITFREDDETTRADAVLDGAGFDIEGWAGRGATPWTPTYR